METVKFNPDTMRVMGKAELMDWWYDLIKRACSDFGLWPGQI